ncbi:MAG TPA: hypothetical protein VGF24_27225 [Vicinamibacterales bacterium]|jgi:tetratricopeptide (TPR) repeat protein
MSWTEKILKWADWTEERLQQNEALPGPGSLAGREPWFDDFLELLGEDGPPSGLQKAFEAVIRDHKRFSARFVGLDLYFKLLHQDPYPLQDELLVDARALAEASYRSLVLTIAAADVPLNERLLDWELRVCSALRMWERANELLARFSECPNVPASDGQAGRAQHMFFRRYLRTESATDDSVADWIWFAHPINENDKFASALVAVSILPGSYSTLPPDAPSAETVYAEVVRCEWPRVRWVKPLMLARLEFDLGLRREAIATLESVLVDDVFPKPMRKHVYEALCTMFEQLGDARATEKFLHAWSFELPDDPKILMKLATVAADSALYEKAFRFLEKAAHLNPDLEREPGARIGLALGAIAADFSTTADVREALTRHPDVLQALEAAVSLYWPMFLQLDEKERPEWAAAIYMMRVLSNAQPPLEPVWIRKAATGFVTVVELQLRRRVFEPIARAAWKNPALMASAKATQSRDHQEWILAQYLLNKGHVALGQMVRILERCGSQTGVRGLDVFVADQIRESPVLLRLGELRRMAAPRNRVVHNLAQMEAEATHADARLVIEACIAHSARSGSS